MKRVVYHPSDYIFPTFFVPYFFLYSDGYMIILFPLLLLSFFCGTCRRGRRVLNFEVITIFSLFAQATLLESIRFNEYIFGLPNAPSVLSVSTPPRQKKRGKITASPKRYS